MMPGAALFGKRLSDQTDNRGCKTGPMTLCHALRLQP